MEVRFDVRLENLSQEIAIKCGQAGRARTTAPWIVKHSSNSNYKQEGERSSHIPRDPDPPVPWYERRAYGGHYQDQSKEKTLHKIVREWEEGVPESARYTICKGYDPFVENYVNRLDRVFQQRPDEKLLHRIARESEQEMER